MFIKHTAGSLGLLRALFDCLAAHKWPELCGSLWRVSMWQGLTVTLCLICPHSLGEKTVTEKSQFLCSEKGGFEPMHLQLYFFGRENLMFIIIFFKFFFSFLVK